MSMILGNTPGWESTNRFYGGSRLWSLVFILFLGWPILAGADYLVLGSYSSQESALAASRVLAAKLNLELMLTTVQVDQRLLYRIVAGPYETAQATGIRERARTAGISAAWLLHEAVTEEVSDRMLTDQTVDSVPKTVKLETNDSTAATIEKVIAGQLPTITLKQAVQIALAQNLGLLASEQNLLSGEAQVRQSRSGLFPQITSGVTQTAIDKDRAEAGFGRAPQYRTSANLKLTQVIYSDDVKAAYDIQNILQSARVSEQQTIVLDTILKVSSGYLTLLRAQSLARIFADDLQLTDSNFDRAKVRLELGVANKAEVYRWETAQAKARKSLVLAEADVERAKIHLNEVLGLPLAEEFLTVTPKVTDTYLLIANPVVWERLQNDAHRKEIRNFWVAEALQSSPDLQALREKQSAQERSVLAAKRSLVIPRIGVALEGTKHLSDGGAGTDQLNIEIPGSDLKFGGTTDNVEWSVGIQASLPLYAGGERYARIAKEQAKLAQLQLAYDDALQNVQASVLQSAASVQASLKNIEYSQDAAEASRNNLQLVIDSYERGVVTNIELLDAQFALLSSELSAANTVFDFILEYLILQRVIGQFDLVTTPEELARVRERMDNFFK